MGSRRDRLSGVRWTFGLLLMTLAAAPAVAAECPTGRFRANAGPDTASGLEISRDGHFRYMLSAGAIDESAQGRWTCEQGVLKLTTEPAPKPAEFRLDKVTKGEEAPFGLIVTWANGSPAALIDFRIELDNGEIVTGYTQDYGWQSDLDGHVAKTVQVSEPFFGTASPVLPVPAGKGIMLHFVLTPNDMGTADFRNTIVTQEDDKLMLHWRGALLPYERDEE